MTHHVVCHSGGHTSALAGIEVARRYGPENVTLLNHDISGSVEDTDIKRFKREVAEYLGLPITYANYRGLPPEELPDQFDVCVKHSAFKIEHGSELCTARLKTEPFMQWLRENASPESTIVYYGFDANEGVRMQRRTGILGALGYRTDYPAALWRERTIRATEEVGIVRPATYGIFTHGNCIGCLKAGWQHWYVVYCTRPDLWAKGKWAEEQIGYAIHHDDDGPVFLADMEDRFAKMLAAGVPATERVQQQTWWAAARRVVKIHEAKLGAMACECAHGGGAS